MAEFIVNCNSCFSRYSPNVSFYVTTCGHMNCESCIARSDDKTKCLVCKSPAQLIPLNSVVDRQVSRSKQNYDYKSLKNKYKFMKEEMVKCYRGLHDLKQENASLHLQLQNMMKAASENKSMPNRPAIFPTPGSCASSSIFTIQPNAIGNNSTLFPQSGQLPNTPWTNSSSVAARMNAHRPFNSRQTFMTPSASSVADDSSENTFNRRPMARIPNSSRAPHGKPSVMMPIRHLKK